MAMGRTVGRRGSAAAVAGVALGWVCREEFRNGLREGLRSGLKRLGGTERGVFREVRLAGVPSGVFEEAGLSSVRPDDARGLSVVLPGRGVTTNGAGCCILTLTSNETGRRLGTVQ
jgi:hypothetical protein